MESENNFDSSTIIKKKRNKKKPTKMTDTDIMNQFMKSLHSNPDEEKISNQQRKKAQIHINTTSVSQNHQSNESTRTQPRT